MNQAYCSCMNFSTTEICIFSNTTLCKFYTLFTVSQDQSMHLFFYYIVISVSQTFSSFLPSLFFVVVWRGHGSRHILAKVQATCGWTRCVAQAMSSLWSSVQKAAGGNTTVCTLRMQECLATLLQVGHL